MGDILEDAIHVRITAYGDILDELRSEATSEEQHKRLWALRECVELARCLRRLVGKLNVQQIHDAFGAPGDFGYETLIGDALARKYGVL